MTAWTPAKVSAFRDGFYEFLNHVVISSKDGRVRLGENLYRAQHMFYDTVFEALAEDIHEIFVLKSRQLGISTGTRALDLFWLGMHEGLRGSLVFDSAFNTAAARREIVESLQNLPKRLHFPGIKSDSRDALVLENDSWLMFRQAGTKNSRSGGGLGRSLGLNLSHGSEISSWASEEGVKSYRQSLSEEHEDRLYIWESTGRGYELWYRMWQEAKDDPYTKRTLFLGWWSKDNQAIPRSDARFSVYAAEPPNKRENERMDAVAKDYGWEITPEQLAWIRWKTDPSRDLDDEDPEDAITTQEQAWVEDDAFQQTGSAFFMADKLTAASARLIEEVKPQSFKFWPGLDFVTCDMRSATTRREVEFRMWEEPVSDSVYIVSADPAFGHDEKNNNSAVQVLRCYADGVDQVGEYASATIQPHQFAWLLWTLIGYYGSTRTGCRVYFIMEINGPGEEVWRQFQSTENIVRQGYLRTAAREKGIADIFQNAQKYIYTRSDSMVAGQSWQWKTNEQNKVQIMEACRNYFHNGAFLVRSMEMLEEMRTITRDGDSIGAENFNRDDRTFAAALGIRAWDERARRPMISGNRTKEAERAKRSLSIEDQWTIFQRNKLTDFFAVKERARLQMQSAAARSAWRAGSRRPQAGRR
jgi:hypothetical protein